MIGEAGARHTERCSPQAGGVAAVRQGAVARCGELKVASHAGPRDDYGSAARGSMPRGDGCNITARTGA